MDHVAEQLALRDRVRRQLSQGMSFDERVRRLLNDTAAPVEQSLEGREHFLRRNFRLRAVGGPQERSHLGG